MYRIYGQLIIDLNNAHDMKIGIQKFVRQSANPFSNYSYFRGENIRFKNKTVQFGQVKSLDIHHYSMNI